VALVRAGTDNGSSVGMRNELDSERWRVGVSVAVKNALIEASAHVNVLVGLRRSPRALRVWCRAVARVDERDEYTLFHELIDLCDSNVEGLRAGWCLEVGH